MLIKSADIDENGDMPIVKGRPSKPLTLMVTRRAVPGMSMNGFSLASRGRVPRVVAGDRALFSRVELAHKRLPYVNKLFARPPSSFNASVQPSQAQKAR